MMQVSIEDFSFLKGFSSEAGRSIAVGILKNSYSRQKWYWAVSMMVKLEASFKQLRQRCLLSQQWPWGQLCLLLQQWLLHPRCLHSCYTWWLGVICFLARPGQRPGFDLFQMFDYLVPWACKGKNQQPSCIDTSSCQIRWHHLDIPYPVYLQELRFHFSWLGLQRARI